MRFAAIITLKYPMIDLSRFFLNPFTDRCISLGNLYAFTTDHLGRLKAKAPEGLAPDRLAATRSALAALDGTCQDDSRKLGERKTQKLNKQAFRKALPAVIAEVNVAVKAKYGERAAQVKGCFPQGRKVFARCRDVMLENYLGALIAELHSIAPDLDPAVPALVEKLRTDWLDLHQASDTAGGRKKTAEESRRSARGNLERELYLNLLALAQAYPLQPEKLAEFMQPSLLFPHRHHPSAPAAATAG